MSDNTITQEQLVALRQENIGRLFMRASRAYSELAFEKLRAYGHTEITPVHGMLIANLDIEGTRATVVAERAGVTKQAIGQLAHDLEKLNYIEKIPDPQDGRASLLKFTEKGMQALHDAHEIKKEIEAEFIAILGEDRMESLREMIQVFLDGQS